MTAQQRDVKYLMSWTVVGFYRLIERLFNNGSSTAQNTDKVFLMAKLMTFQQWESNIAQVSNKVFLMVDSITLQQWQSYIAQKWTVLGF